MTGSIRLDHIDTSIILGVFSLVILLSLYSVLGVSNGDSSGLNLTLQSERIAAIGDHLV